GNRDRVPRRQGWAKDFTCERLLVLVHHACKIRPVCFTLRRRQRRRRRRRNRRRRWSTWWQIDEAPSPAAFSARCAGRKGKVLAVARHRPAAHVLGQVPIHLACGLLKVALLDELQAWKIELDEVPWVDADPLGERDPRVPGRHRMTDSCWRHIALGNR